MHFAIEIGESQDGKCGKCGGETCLVTPYSEWKLDTKGVEFDELVEIAEEVTAHYCKKCKVVTGFWINT